MTALKIPDWLQRFRTEAQHIVSIAAPMLVAQLAQMGMSVTDVIMAGHLSADDLAAVSIGAGLWIPFLLLLAGTILITSSLIANQSGAQNFSGVRVVAQQAIWLGAFLGILGTIWALSIHHSIALLGVNDDVRFKATGYLEGIALGALANGIGFALRNFCEGLGNPKPIMKISLIALVLNIPLNYVFMFGTGPLHALGGAGCGWATGVVNWLVLAMVFWHISTNPKYRSFQPFEGLFNSRPDWKQIRRIVSLGLPIGIAIFFETSLFSAMSLLIAKFGSSVLSAHEIAHNVSAIIFMIPLSLGMAITVRVGFLLGENRQDQVRFSAFTGISIALLLAVLSFVFTIFFRVPVAALYTSDAEVQNIAANILFFSAFFQCSDAIQVCSSGALRAYQDTAFTMRVTFVAYWIIGLPSGYLLAETNVVVPTMGAPGYWIGTTLGLTVAAIILATRFNRLSK